MVSGVWIFAGHKLEAADILISTNATWRYLDDGSDQGTNWVARGFDDTAWKSGPAQLGFGEGDEATVVSRTNAAGAQIITYYFRHTFNVVNPGAYLVGQLRVKRDDGVILYLNGVEIYRNGFGPGTVTSTTLAANASDDGQTFFSGNYLPSLLLAGPNVLAAEVHQSSTSSSDVTFELELLAGTENNPPSAVLLSPTEGAVFTAPATIGLTASATDLDGLIARVEFYQGTAKLGEDTSSPYTWDWTGVAVGSYALRAVAVDNIGARGTSAVVNVSVQVATPPTVAGRSPAPGPVTSLTNVSVVFSEAVTGVDAGDLLVSGVPAVAVSGAASNYVFTLPPLTEGTQYVAWKGAHGIVDFESPPKAFDNFGPGATWQYTLTDTVAPRVVAVSPAPGSTLNVLTSIEVTFSEAVAGVDAADLTLNGAAAAGVSGSGAGPYRFTFAQPGNGSVNVSWLAGHGIRDFAAARNAFAGGAWSYVLNTNATWSEQVVISEIMYHPSSENTADEWIEIFNRGATAVSLAGWRLNRAIDFGFPSISLAAGRRLVIAANLVAFGARYPGVTNVVGGWTGRLSNVRDEVELEDASGNRVDLVEYADQGDWAVRTLNGPTWQGWGWSSAADGLGASLELRQAGLPNDHGQNWQASVVTGGTPGGTNSVATTNLPPMILDPTHLPVVPRSTNAITFLARILDESSSGLVVRLWTRDAGVSPLGAFASTVMLDNGLNNDGVAEDGLYGAVLPARGAGFLGEYYIEAVDGAGQTRTWPAPGDVGGGTLAQDANAFFQVDDEVYTGRQPIYRILMRVEDQATLFSDRDRVQRNATFVTVEGGDVQVRHSCATRRRGASSYNADPPTMKFDIPRDRMWNNKSSINLNSVNTYAQVLGAAVALQSGLPAPYTTAVQLRFNGVNRAKDTGTTGRMFGSWAAVEVANDEWARDHLPDDPNGNVYSKRRPECWLEYLGTNPQSYINCAYDKESNASDNDWTDLMNLTFALDPDTTPANVYVQAVRQNVNVDEWMRYFAVLFLLNYNETALSNGADDDYDLYRGIVDPRFMVLPHDFDSIFGSAGSTTDNLFLAAAIPNVSRFLHHPDFEPLYYAEYRRQLAGAFSTNHLFPLMDQMLGDWVTDPAIQDMKNNALGRINYVLGALPAAPSVVRATVAGEPDSPTYQTTATLTVAGTDVTHFRYRLNGGPWSADQLVAQTINLSGLTNGHYTVFVVGRNSAGTWQSDADATPSRTWAVLSGLRRVVINEVLADNDGAVNHEGTFPDIVELYNPTGSPTVDLSGYRVTDDLNDPNKFVIPPGTTLAGGAYRLLFGDNAGSTSGLHLGFGLDRDGDTLYLLDRATNGLRVIDSVAFGWQLANRSIGRLPNGQWGLCTPTAGAANAAAAVGSTGTLKINEWLANPASPFVEDFVELYNPDAQPVNLGGLFLTDRPLGQAFKHRIASLSFVEGYGYRVFIADGKSGAGPDHLNFSLAAEGGELALLRDDGTIVDQIYYTTQTAGISQGRSPNGGTRIVYFDQPTPGAGNPAASGGGSSTLALIPLNGTFQWKYNDTGADLGTAWVAPGYNDSGWPGGPAVLGFDNNLTFLEPLRTPLTVASPKVTYYFRAHFNVPPGLTVAALRAVHLTDDGAVFHLNGVEVGRFGLPAVPAVITNGTLATSHEATVFETMSLNPGSLVTGDNVIAVEVHQADRTSSDLVFGMRLEADVVTARILINEVLANARNSTNTDGTISDWAEFFNPSSGSVDLSGLSLSDQLTNPRRWVFPTGSVIAGGGYRMVRFDANLPASSNLTAMLNTGFGLKSGGDSLYLFNRPQDGGELLDSVSFGLQAADFSIGRVPSGGSNWVLNLPSPGSINIASALGNRALLKVNEWMAAPGSGDDWFELFNAAAQPVDVSGLYLSDDLNDRLKYPPLPPRSFIAAGLAGFQKFIADGSVTAGADHVPFGLKRTGDEIGISDPQGTLIDSIGFGPQVTGVSEGRLPDGATNVVAFPETPTPDESNYLPIPNVVINEVLTHSDLPLEDAIELRNTGGTSVNISGWFLSDARTVLKKYRIPNNITIPANGFKVFYEYQFNPIPNDPGSFSLSSAKGDEVYLSAADAQSVLTGYRAQVDFGPAANGVSFGRYVTSALNGNRVDFVAMAARTFGADSPPTVDDFRTGTGKANSGPRVGPVVISEIMYHPPDLTGGLDNLTDEFIELQNITATAVPLYDPAASTNRWKLRDAVSFEFPPGTSIPANGIIVVVGFSPADTALLNAFKAKYAVQAGAVILGPYDGKLDNSSDSVELARPDPPQTIGPDAGLVPYILVDKVKYFDTYPWPLGPDGGGQSLTRVTAGAYGNDPANWSAATPSPGPQGPSQDTDGDGMPNAWETQYGLNPLVNDAGLDLDGDGMRNLDEYLAGTAPNDPGSVLRLAVISGPPALLRFNAAANVSYTVEFKTVLAPGPWATLQSVPAGAARTVQITDGAPGPRYYRVRTP